MRREETPVSREPVSALDAGVAHSPAGPSRGGPGHIHALARALAVAARAWLSGRSSGLWAGRSALLMVRPVFLLAVASQPARYGPVRLTASFPLTAAGQPRIRTGFPLASPLVLGVNH